MNAAATISKRQRIERVLYFFPLQLLVLHVKKNLFLVFFWVLLFGFALNYFAARYGVSYQFLFPEYVGRNSPVAFAMVGFSLGGFILAFNLYTYILHGFRFPFIATLNRPFLKFSINNFILPTGFVVTYMIASIRFQATQELLGASTIVFNMLGFSLGMFVFLVLSRLYFLFTNKNVLNYTPQERVSKRAQAAEETEMVRTNLHRAPRFGKNENVKRDWQVETYLISPLRIGLARTAKHYKRDVLSRVFAQNHLNASLFELILIVSFVIIGSFRENPFFVLPAAASVLLMFTILLMLVSILYTWIRGWTLSVFLLAFLAINYSEPRFGLLKLDNHAYGLNYTVPKARYDLNAIYEPERLDSLAAHDFKQTLDILDRWRLKNQRDAVLNSSKPKLVIINTSGGGSRSALWTISSLANADSVLGGKLLQHTAFISGSSGGMIGAAYLRELYLRWQMGEMENLYDQRFRVNMSKDLLNPVIFSIATNDFFIRYQAVIDGDQAYTKDRAWAFEKQLNANLEGVLEKRLGDYIAPERQALIPLMVMAPTIVNDGRRLLVSSTPCAYLTQNSPIHSVNYTSLGEDVEFSRLFADQNAMNLRFSSALRMNATFPYVMPIVSLPAQPALDVMDAGLRDNFGIKTTLQFLYTFRNWINTNTSGVVIVQVRDVEREAERHAGNRSVLNRITAPLGSVSGNFIRMQDFNNDQMIRYLSAWFENEIDIVTFQLAPEETSSVSLSWHLTSREKETIRRGLESQSYQAALEQLKTAILP
jgi:hypothetical protein